MLFRFVNFLIQFCHDFCHLLACGAAQVTGSAEGRQRVVARLRLRGCTGSVFAWISGCCGHAHEKRTPLLGHVQTINYLVGM